MAGERLIWKAAKTARRREAFFPRLALARARLLREARRIRPYARKG